MRYTARSPTRANFVWESLERQVRRTWKRGDRKTIREMQLLRHCERQKGVRLDRPSDFCVTTALPRAAELTRLFDS